MVLSRIHTAIFMISIAGLGMNATQDRNV